jgi:hypothetical protein
LFRCTNFLSAEAPAKAMCMMCYIIDTLLL